MQFWYNGFPVVRYRTGSDAGFSYWYNGFPAGGVQQAVVDGVSVTWTQPLFVPLIEATITPLIVPVKLTQQGRQAVTEEAAPAVRITQLGRFGLTEEDAPAVRLTQMGRQVLYPFTCVPEIPTPGPCPDSMDPGEATPSGCGTTIGPTAV